MKKTYNIDVDCASCAIKAEEAARKTEGVKDASINFMTLKMTVEFANGTDERKVMKSVLKNCRKIERDFDIEL
ncbi:MAG: cation transporter [Eubacteriales bacterium]|nr:cation transporter [Eubacteriales bacterium]